MRRVTSRAQAVLTRIHCPIDRVSIYTIISIMCYMYIELCAGDASPDGTLRGDNIATCALYRVARCRKRSQKVKPPQLVNKLFMTIVRSECRSALSIHAHITIAVRLRSPNQVSFSLSWPSHRLRWMKKTTGQTPLEIKLVTCPALTMPRLHTRTHTLWHTRIVTGVHIHIRSILSIALLGHTHTHTRSRRELRFGAGLETCNLYFVFLSFFSFCIRSAN